MKRKYALWGAAAGAVLALGLAAVLLWKQEAPRTPVTVLDKNGNVLISIEDEKLLSEDPRWAYLEITLEETVQLLQQARGYSREQAQKHLFQDGLTVKTNFDTGIFNRLKEAAAGSELAIGSAVTDLNGNLLAVWSQGGTDNYAAQKTAPYSAFKPLSVYTPALEADAIHWASSFEDSAYRQLTGTDGSEVDWPVNATGTYSGKQVNIGRALAQSLNTVAVKCLAEYGVADSMEFLQKKLQIPLLQEAQAMEVFGEEEILGSLALGYLEAGVSPVDMAGYYQIFANGGKYLAPRAVTQITDSREEQIYLRQEEPEQIVSPATADTMNKLLQGVVSYGTGTAAACEGIAVAGKTGTGDQNAGNWFVGVTAGYSCSVWHGQAQENEAAAIFADVIRGIYAAQPELNRNFITHKNVYPIVFCTQSGQAISAGCTDIDMGYFATQDALPICNIHSNQD